MFTDLRQALRLLLKSPGFSALISFDVVNARAVESARAGKGHIFDPWPQAAPMILEFVGA